MLALASNEINAVRISGDGSRIVFRIYRDTSLRETSPAQPIERGIYVINADGSGLRQLVGPAQIAPLLGVAPADAPFFSAIFGLDVSTNGGQIVFGMFIAPESGGWGQGLFAVNGDGSGLRQLLGRVGWVLNGAISGDGTTVAYVIEHLSDDLQEAGVIGFDGGGQRKLTDNTIGYPGLGTIFSLPSASSDRIQLSAGGTRLLFGSTGLLYDTTSGERLILGATTSSVAGDPTPLVIDGLARSTMNAEATRFAYVFQPFAEPYQIARLDLNPGDLGGAPSVSEATVSPPFVLTETGSTATVSARVSTPNTFLRVGSRVLFRGLPDPNVNTWYWGPMVDDGASLSDAVAGDDVFTYDGVGTDCCAEVGSRIVRVKAETQAADGLRHATAVDIVPFAVVADPGDVPTPVPPTATAIPPTATVAPPTATAVPPTATPLPPTPATAIPPTAPTSTSVPADPSTPPAMPETTTPVSATSVPAAATGCDATSPGAVSFATAVVAYDPLAGGAATGPNPESSDPEQAVGPPNADATTRTGSVSLGNGGYLILQFADNALGGDGTAAPDVWICEVAADGAEAMTVVVSTDGATWVDAGTVPGGYSGVDLDAFGLGPDDRMTFVGLSDDPNQGDFSFTQPGADIDAVGVVSGIDGPEDPPGVTETPTSPETPGLPPSPTLTPTPAPQVTTIPAGTETGAVQDTPLTTDFVTPDPAECTTTPRSAEELNALLAAPAESDADALDAAMVTPGLDVPASQPADEATTAAVTTLYRQMVACLNAGNDLAALALWTDEALRQFQPAAPPEGAPTPVPEEEREAVRVTEVRVLPDGRLVAVWTVDSPMFDSSAVQIVVQQDDRYLVDEILDISFE